MAGSNDFLVFAGQSGANVISQSTYAALAALGPGFTAGIANSNQLNKVWRQSSIMSSVLAQFMADVTGQNSTDDGTTANLLTNLMTSLVTAGTGPESGSGNTFQVTLTPATQVLPGSVIRFIPTHANTGASTFSVNGSPSNNILGLDNAPLTGGEIVSGALCEVVWNGTANVWVLISNYAGWQKAATPPAGDNSTKVATTAFVQANGLGSSQTWHNVTGSRALSTNYTNNHGNPIMVSVLLDVGTSWAVSFIVGGVTIGGTGGNGTAGGGSFIVPAGATYQVSGSGETIVQWAELY
jgi:hypothetical protein